MSAAGGELPPASDRTGPASPVTGASWEWDMAPGAPRAVTRGCLCSVLANAAYRSHAEEQPFVDPECPVHGVTGGGDRAPAAS